MINKEVIPSLLLIASTVLALLVANTALVKYYNLLIDIPFSISLGDFQLSKPLLLWINDGLMAVFFFLLGLELKREVVEGKLSKPADMALPGAAAVGGMLVPAFIYTAINWQDPVALQGWAIPAATDIAFALGVLALIGKAIPTSLKVFLISLAIIDDIGAILIIAIFYTSKISILSLIIGFVCMVLLFIFNRLNIYKLAPYMIVGLIMWVAVLKSGVHATLAGVVLALFIPIKSREHSDYSPAKRLERDLHGFVVLFIIPLFAFVNSGVELKGMSLGNVLHPITLGIIVGLVVGKQIGVFLFSYVAVKLGFARLPSDMSWKMVYGVSVICGIGFTMSLFIGSLAFEETGVNLLVDERLGILMASLISGVFGYYILKRAVKPNSY
ncbi:MAG: Na+/H+ antiporter NhaA [Gammaproteobacteria bacterium]|nr:Na+/H+ antiporter NhaA [Gammaproteobacteria bacterium]